MQLIDSPARGEPGPDSDFDTLLAVSDAATVERRRSSLAHRVLWEPGVAVDVVVMTHTHFSDRRRLRASLPVAVVAEGALLHAARPARRTHTLARRTKAGEGLRAAGGGQAAGPPLPDEALLHSQHAVGKARKALLVWRDQPFHRTDDLSRLGQQCVALAPLLAETAPLTRCAWRHR